VINPIGTSPTWGDQSELVALGSVGGFSGFFRRSEAVPAFSYWGQLVQWVKISVHTSRKHEHRRRVPPYNIISKCFLFSIVYNAPSEPPWREDRWGLAVLFIFKELLHRGGGHRHRAEGSSSSGMNIGWYRLRIRKLFALSIEEVRPYSNKPQHSEVAIDEVDRKIQLIDDNWQSVSKTWNVNTVDSGCR